MRIFSAVVDKRPSECSACPICGRVRARAPCGELKVIKGNGNNKYVKIPDYRCLLKVKS
nr:MAG TPA: hypothetical protein [Caudoviricetes sp.]